MLYLSFVLLVVFSIVLALATSLILKSVKKISSLSGIGDYAVANLIIALSTSLPELVIAIQASLNNQSSLSLGNILGSNIADLSVVIGGAIIIGGTLKIGRNILEHDVYYAFLITAAPLVLLFDGKLDRLDGFLLFVLFLLWQFISLGNGRRKLRGSILDQRRKTKSKILKNKKEALVVGSKLLVGLIGLLLSAQVLVGRAEFLATHFKIPPLVIGIFLIGLGSSLPELVLQTKAIRNKESSIALGDLFGSIVSNSSLILGINALISPFSLGQPHLYITTTMFFLLTFFFFFLFINTKEELERWEGAILLMLYFILAAIELI